MDKRLADMIAKPGSATRQRIEEQELEMRVRAELAAHESCCSGYSGSCVAGAIFRELRDRPLLGLFEAGDEWTQPPPYYSEEQKDGWRQAMAQARTIVDFYQRGIRLPTNVHLHGR